MRLSVVVMSLLLSNYSIAEEAPLVEEALDNASPVLEAPAPQDSSINTTAEPADAVESGSDSVQGKVKLAVITSGVVDRSPQDELDQVANTIDKLYFFTDLRGFQGQTISHVWIYQDKEMANVPFEVKAPRWRVWSSKSLLPTWLGSWTVRIIDTAGNLVQEKSFEYITTGE